ncbi:MAG: HAD-IB family hydrolase [Streptosporangiaceae bacterium]
MPDLGDGPILLTGATGFIGQAVLERLLADHPRTRVVLLLRGRPGTSADSRLRRLLGKPVFRSWRERVGDDGVQRALRDQLSVIEADVARDVPDLPADLRAVIHGASVVSFDPPVDDAFRTNVLGTANLYDAVRRCPARPHIVHISTAFVAGVRKGVVPEASLTHDVEWPAELAWALSARDEVERASRDPGVLSRAHREAMREDRTAGPQAVASATERRRKEAVTERLTEYGGARAHSLGWPDVYTLTKALGERVAEEKAAGPRAAGERAGGARPVERRADRSRRARGEAGDGLPLSIVRPAIVESALRRPYPGWIDGFKMADPLILAYGRGTLTDFPGIPDGILDIVPVDIVVSTLLAATASPPDPGNAAYYHVGTSARNPLTVQGLYELIRGYFEAEPLSDPEGRGQARAPELAFRGGVQVDRTLRTADRLMTTAERALLALPGNERTGQWQGRLHRRHEELAQLRRYQDLYGHYVEVEAAFDDSHTFALHRSLPEDDRDTAGLDAADVDWAYYLQRVHCPRITSSLRRTPGRRRPRPRPALVEGDGIAAVFDLEGTVLASNVIETYLWARLLDAPAREWPGELLSVAGALPRAFLAERRGRGDFLRTFLRHYDGASERELRRLVRERLADLLLRRAFPRAVRRVREHRSAGHRTVLVTGTVDILVEPFEALFDEVAASRLRTVDGRCTGHLTLPPLVGEARAGWLTDWAAQDGIDLAASWAYGDHYSDRPFLELVGHPVAVNPDARLYRHATRKQWRVERWSRDVLGPAATLFEGLIEGPAVSARGVSR